LGKGGQWRKQRCDDKQFAHGRMEHRGILLSRATPSQTARSKESSGNVSGAVAMPKPNSETPNPCAAGTFANLHAKAPLAMTWPSVYLPQATLLRYRFDRE
jgi:hypothetical protein